MRVGCWVLGASRLAGAPKWALRRVWKDRLRDVAEARNAESRLGSETLAAFRISSPSVETRYEDR